jgi:ribosomal protein L4
MNAKEKKAALKSALSPACEGREVLVVVNDMSVDEAKTKSFAQKMAGIGVEGKALLVDTVENTNAVLAARNNPSCSSSTPCTSTCTTSSTAATSS